MAYGKASIGQLAYGGTSYESGGPSLKASTPTDGAVQVSRSEALLLVLTSPARVDADTVSVAINGTQAIVSGTFLPGFSGTLLDQDEDLYVTVETHPLFLTGLNTVTCSATDLAGYSDSWEVEFSGDSFVVALSEEVTVVEDVHLDQDLDEDILEEIPLVEEFLASLTVILNESVSVSESVDAILLQRPSIAETVAFSSTTSVSHPIYVTHIEDVPVYEDFWQSPTQLIDETVDFSESHQDLWSVGVHPTETVTFSEGFSVSRGRYQAFEETVAVSETASASMTVILTETVSVSEEVALQYGWRFLTSYTHLLTEDHTFSKGQTESASETIPLGEAYSSDGGPFNFETVSLSEGQALFFAYAQDEVITVPFVEDLAVSYPVSVDLSDSVSVAEAVLAARGAPTIDAPETVDVVDDVALLSDYQRENSESVTVVEDVALGLGHEEPLSETVTVSDDVLTSIGKRAAISESIGFLEELALSGVYVQDNDTPVPFVEEAVATIPFFADPAESVALSESFDEVQVRQTLAEETVDLVEDVAVLAVSNLALSENLGVVEDLVAEAAFYVVATEPVAFSESATGDKDVPIVVTESAGVTEELTLLKEGTEAILETVPFLELLEVVREAVPVTEAETVTLSESADAQFGGVLLASESLGASEDVALTNAGTEDLVETVACTEDVVALSGGVVTCLEDVVTLEASEVQAQFVVDADELDPLIESSETFADHLGGGGEAVVLGELLSTHYETAVSEDYSTPFFEEAIIFEGVQTEIVTSLITVEDLVVYQTFQLPVAESVLVSDSVEAEKGYGQPIDEEVLTGESLSTDYAAHAVLGEDVDLYEDLLVVHKQEVFLEETLSVSEFCPTDVMVHTREAVSLLEAFTVGTLEIWFVGDVLQVRFPASLSLDGVVDLEHYQVQPVGAGFPVKLLGAEPLFEVGAAGTHATLISIEGMTTWVQLEAAIAGDPLYDYLRLNSEQNACTLAKIIEVDTPNQRVRVDRVLYLGDQDNGQIPWEYRQVVGVQLTTSKPTNGREYWLIVRGLVYKTGSSAATMQSFLATAPRPRVIGAEMMPQGAVLVTFGEPMLAEPSFVDYHEYSIHGDTPVEVVGAQSVSERQVLLATRGLQAASFKVVVTGG